MNELWDSMGILSAERQRTLSIGDITALLQQGQVQFVVADCGHPLNWVPLQQCYDFWKNEVKSRIGDAEAFEPADFPGGYCYVASEWAYDQSSPIVLLEKYH